jgi:hypothetical protein
VVSVTHHIKRFFLFFFAVNSLDVFHFEGEGLAFKGKLIGIKDIDAARGDEMCQHAMQELKNALKQSKEHKARINISVSLSGLKIKDDKGTVSSLTDRRYAIFAYAPLADRTLAPQISLRSETLAVQSV